MSQKFRMLMITMFLFWADQPLRADFIGLTTDFNVVRGSADVLGGGHLTWRIYAIFDDPNDVLWSVRGTPDNPMNIQVNNQGTFYQDPVGADRAVSTTLYSLFPSLEFDSFVTIGEPGPFNDSTFLSPWPGFTDDFLGGTFIGWHRSISDPQAWAVNGRQDLGGFGILIGQFTHDTPQGQSDINGIRFEALILHDVIGGGAAQSTYVSQFFIVLPGPGGAALLTGAGLTALKRRKRRLVN